jgi:hypothetical protein
MGKSPEESSVDSLAGTVIRMASRSGNAGPSTQSAAADSAQDDGIFAEGKGIVVQDDSVYGCDRS